ncbi:hypothetical protein Tco_1577743 [Tanacetum coccineum]
MDGRTSLIDLNVSFPCGKAKSLSVGEMINLNKSVLESLPIYYLSHFRAPSKVINALEYIRSRGFFGFKENQRGISWVKWKTILLDMDKGGLGVGSILAKNLGLIGKWKWLFLIEKDALWRAVIQEFYGVDGGIGADLFQTVRVYSVTFSNPFQTLGTLILLSETLLSLMFLMVPIFLFGRIHGLRAYLGLWMFSQDFMLSNPSKIAKLPSTRDLKIVFGGGGVLGLVVSPLVEEL